MSRKCLISEKGVLFGNNVSHSNRKTRRRFLPNLQKVSLMSFTLGFRVQLRISTAALRTIEHNGGIDAYLLSVRSSTLSSEALALKKRILRAKERLAACASDSVVERCQDRTA